MTSLFNVLLCFSSLNGSSIDLNSKSHTNLPPKGVNLPVQGTFDFDLSFQVRTEIIAYKRKLTDAKFHTDLKYLDGLRR